MLMDLALHFCFCKRRERPSSSFYPFTPVRLFPMTDLQLVFWGDVRWRD